MDEKTLVFDDWAMYLTENWIEADLANDRDDCFRALLTYLCQFLHYDVPRHRYGYASYFMVVLDKPQYDGLSRISDYLVEGGIIPTLRHPAYPHHLHRDILEFKATIMFHFFDK